MELIGHLLKEGNRIGYERMCRRTEKTKHDDLQLNTLKSLLRQARSTSFGMLYDFERILNSDNPQSEFQRAIPLTNYTQFHENWLHYAIQGFSDVIWPGKIQYFAKSSGTSGASSKLIPVSHEMLHQFHRTTLKQIAGIHELHLSESFYNSKVLILGGSTELDRPGNGIRTGDLSGILASQKSIAFQAMTKPGRKTAKMKDWNEKIERIVKKADRWNIGVISGIPSWVTLLLERIVSHHKLENIHEIWPNLELYVHGGVFIDPYRAKLEKLFGRSVHYQNTYLASEGYFGYQKNFQENELELLSDAGIYYEFVDPRDFEYLKNGSLYYIPTLTLDEVEPGKQYAMIISTCSGLCRYSLEDIVEFTGRNTIQIVGRLNQSLNICGEHLSEINLTEAIQETARSLQVNVSEFCVHPSKEYDRLYWYIGSNSTMSINQFEAVLDYRLAFKNDDYATVRKTLLKSPRVKQLPAEKFYEFMEIKKKFGAQHKFPRVLKDGQIKEWEIFLTNMDQYSALDNLSA